MENTTQNTTFFGVTLPKVELPKVELPKFDLPKFDLTKFELPKLDLNKVEFPKVDRATFNDAAEAVKNAASETVLTATQTATKVRNGAAYTVTLVREAVGV
jgi:hypothetical protein